MLIFCMKKELVEYTQYINEYIVVLQNEIDVLARRCGTVQSWEGLKHFNPAA